VCTIGCVRLDESMFIFKNRDPIRGTPTDERVDSYPAKDSKIIVIRNDVGCYGGINSSGVGIVGTFVNMNEKQNNYFDGGNLITILEYGDISSIVGILKRNPLNLYGNIICSDSNSAYAFELNGSEIHCTNIENCYVMTNHFQKINRKIRTIDNPFISKWTNSRLTCGRELVFQIKSKNDIIRLLSDHSGYPDYSICNHGIIPTTSSYIIDCTEKRVLQRGWGLRETSAIQAA